MLLHTASITSLVSLVSCLSMIRNTIVVIIYVGAEIYFIFLKSSREYYKKVKCSLAILLFVILLILGFEITYNYIS